MAWVLGNKLSDKVRAAVLNSYVHRMTYENNKARPCNCSFMRRSGYCLPLVSDNEWLASHCFYITKGGKLSRRHIFAAPAYMHNVERISDHAR